MPNTTPVPFAAESLSARQLEILDQAVLLLQEQGLPGLTVRRLAERMGFSEAALYRHFSSKEELLVSLVGRLAEERLLGPIRRIAEDESRPVRERVRAILEHQIDNLLQLQGVPMLFLAEALASEDEGLLARARWVVGSLTGVLASLLRRIPGEPGDPPPESLVPLLFGLGAGTALRFRLAADPSEHPDPEAVHRVVRFALDRLLAPTGETDRNPGDDGPHPPGQDEADDDGQGGTEATAGAASRTDPRKDGRP